MRDLWTWIEGTELAFQIGATWWFPLLESIHVLGLAVLLGSVLMQDLRMLGWTAMRYSPDQLADGVLMWVWVGFLLALITGLGMFISRPSHYAANPAFQSKLVLLIAAGMNLFLFRLVELTSARIAAGVSLTIWAGVVLAGRWAGHLN